MHCSFTAQGLLRYEVLWSTHRFSSNQSDMQPEEAKGFLDKAAVPGKTMNTSALLQVMGIMARIQTTSPGLGWFSLFL